ncbi:MAG: DEAD/DEAH box helicase [Deltaproteobacteria bacterium]|jgi:ATP-dependent RNA helicase RhlB|nr:DEAD/DEAH box helicase [Deltaproteobacteria bacterium]
MPLTVDGTEPVAALETALEPSMGQPLDEPTDDPMKGEETAALEAPPERAARPNFLTSTRFTDFTLPPEIMSGLDAAGFECCTPIQAQVIPVALEGRDIAGQAQTGTGKTAAFLVPLLERLLRKPPALVGLPRALVITPTRELAQQIHHDAKILASFTDLSTALVIGGLEYKEQAQTLEAGADIVICTPGRILDYIQQGVFDPRAVEIAVVDEADRLLDLGFIKDLKRILAKLPPYSARQTMLFSATLDERVLELTYQFMNPPQYITAEPDPTSKVQIDQMLYHVSLQEKLPLLLGLLKKEPHHRVIIFCNTKSSVEWLTKKLVLNNFQAEGITGDLPQPKRLRLMEDFKEKRLQIMVATDVASRGIHVEDVSHVYNYDLPQDAENYIHRIGRTARAGKSGKAISFACESHVFHLEAIENILGEKIPVVWADDDLFVPDHTRDVKLKDRLPRKGRFGDRNGDRNGDRYRERSTDRPERRFDDSKAKGLARSMRPGGIFGLSPRQPVTETTPDVRQVLLWTPATLDGPVGSKAPGQPVLPGPGGPPSAPGAEPNLSGQPSPSGQPGLKAGVEPREGRRRKRRRGKNRFEDAAPSVSPGNGLAPAETSPPSDNSSMDAPAPLTQGTYSRPVEPTAWPEGSVVQVSLTPNGREVGPFQLVASDADSEYRPIPTAATPSLDGPATETTSTEPPAPELSRTELQALERSTLSPTAVEPSLTEPSLTEPRATEPQTTAPPTFQPSWMSSGAEKVKDGPAPIALASPLTEAEVADQASALNKALAGAAIEETGLADSGAAKSRSRRPRGPRPPRKVSPPPSPASPNDLAGPTGKAGSLGASSDAQPLLTQAGGFDLSGSWDHSPNLTQDYSPGRDPLDPIPLPPVSPSSKAPDLRAAKEPDEPMEPGEAADGALKPKKRAPRSSKAKPTGEDGAPAKPRASRAKTPKEGADTDAALENGTPKAPKAPRAPRAAKPKAAATLAESLEAPSGQPRSSDPQGLMDQVEPGKKSPAKKPRTRSKSGAEQA